MRTPARAAPDADTAGVSTAVRALVIDDHCACRRALEELVAAAGFEVVGTADSGEGAVAAAAELAPDLVLLDVRMPGMGGRAAAAAIAAGRSETVVVLVSATAHGGDVIAKSALSAGLLRGLWRVRAPAGRSHPLPADSPDRSLGAR